MKRMNLDSIVAVAEEDELKNIYYKNFKTIYQGRGNLGARLNRVYSFLKNKYDEVYFIGADSPHISFEKLEKEILTFSSLKNNFLLGRALDGGYYIFGGKSRVNQDQWLNVEYSSSKTFRMFKENLKDVHELDKEFDLDDLSSLKLLKNYNRNHFDSSQNKFLRWLFSFEL